jgi:hypothetical protein
MSSATSAWTRISLGEQLTNVMEISLISSRGKPDCFYKTCQ